MIRYKDWAPTEEETYRRKELEAREEAWNGYLCSEVGAQLMRYPHPLKRGHRADEWDMEGYWDSIPEAEQRELFEQALEDAGCYWKTSSDGAYIAGSLEWVVEALAALLKRRPENGVLEG